jgi:hypothetical protein
MTKEEILNTLGVTGFVYFCSSTKSDKQICEDLQVSSFTMTFGSSKYVVTETVVEHPDYTSVE